MPKRRSPAGLVAAAAAVVLLSALVGPVASAAAVTASATGTAPTDAGCDATWRPAPVDDPRAPVGAGLTGPAAIGVGEPAIFFVRRGADDAAVPWTLFFPTTDSFGLPTTEGTVPPGPSLLAPLPADRRSDGGGPGARPRRRDVRARHDREGVPGDGP